MNQLFTFNSEQFTANLKPTLPKKIIAIEQRPFQIKVERNTSTFRFKKQIKRYEQIIEIASRNTAKQQSKKIQLTTNEQLRNYIAGHFSNSAISLQPATLKLIPKKDTSELKVKSKRCNSEMDTTKTPENMLFTFYPKENQAYETLASTDLSQEINPHKLELRSFSLKNAPIVDYRNSNKILPKVFRMKGKPEQESLVKKAKNLSELSTGQGQQRSEQNSALKESNRADRRNYSIKNWNLAMRNKTQMCGNVERLHPLKQIQLVRTMCRNE